MDTDYSPEDSNYYQGIGSNLLIITWIAVLLVIVFFVFVIGRFLCKKCEATIERDETYSEEKRDSYVCGTWLIGLVVVASLSSTLYGGIMLYRETINTRTELRS